MVRKISSLLMMLLLVQLVLAQAPAGYYKNAKGTKERALKTALYKIISANYRVVGYDGLYEAYEETDNRNGKVWDMYSDMTNYDFRKDRAGNYKKEGDCYNREHTFPQSWFSGSTMKSDLFNVYPTDGKINGMRSNYPYGETDGDRFKSHNGWSKLGRCKTPGYSGTVFEPNDEYKGDIARTYFYIVTCYENKIAGWGREMMAHNSYPAFAPWALDMLLRWAKEDPVSKKEIDRNNAVYKWQHNRNPYIDYPGLEQYVWGDKRNVAFDPDNYEQSGGGDTPEVVEVSAPTFSLPAGTVAAGSRVSIACATSGATLYYSVNSTPWKSSSSTVTLTLNEDATISAYAKMGNKQSTTVTRTYTVEKEDVKVPAPTFSRPSGEVEEEAEISIICPAGCDGIVYRINGGEWSTSKTTAVITLTSEATVEAYAVRGEEKSETVSATYTIKINVAAPKFSIAGGEVEKGSVVTVSSADAGAIIYYRINDGKLNSASSEAKVKIEEDCKISAYAKVAGKTSETVTYSFTVKVAVKVPVPTFSRPSGEVEEEAEIIITCPAGCDGIVYRVNGDEWLTAEHTATITITSKARVEAYAVRGKEKSEIVTAEYTLQTITGIEDGFATPSLVRIFTIDGRLLRQNVTYSEAVKGLPRGFYVIDGKKVVIR